MAPPQNMQSYPSIQSFYKREITEERTSEQSGSAVKGDGFTEEELADALDPLSRRWNPERDYEELPIAALTPRPGAVTFCGRIVNLSTNTNRGTKAPPKAAGWHNLIVKDDSAAIAIKLYFAKSPYPLKFGQLVSIWTVFISDSSKAETFHIPGITLYANLFPGRATSDHVMIHTTSSSDTICRTPLDYVKGQPLHHLLTLDNYLSNSGHDGITGVKLLVCVKSIGGKKRISRKDGGEYELADLLLFDHTGEVRMTVWNEVIESAKEWQPGRTILLISNPGYQIDRFTSKGKIAISRGTSVDIDPEFADGDWLRRYAAGLTKKDSLCMRFPEGVWDAEAAKKGVVRMLFTLAEIDNWVRRDGQHVFTGFINVVIMEVNLVSLHRRNMLMCGECCGVPIFFNSPITPCRNCTKPCQMILNPRIFGTLLDETGCIAAGKLLWSDDAWRDFFDREPEEISRLTAEEVRLFEQRLLWMRCHLVVGWSEDVGRLGVLGMMA